MHACKDLFQSLEQTAGINDQSAKQVILLADVDGIRRAAAIERWKAENESAPTMPFLWSWLPYHEPFNQGQVGKAREAQGSGAEK